MDYLAGISFTMRTLTALTCLLLIPGALGVSAEGGTSVTVDTSPGLVEGVMQTDGLSAAADTTLGSAAYLKQDTLIRDSIGELISSTSTINLRPGTGVIQSAVNAASPGSKIKLSAGKYIDNVEIDKPLKIEGSCKCTKQVIESASEGGSVFRIEPGIYVTLANMVIQGGTGTPTDLGILGGGIYNQGYLTLKECTIGTTELGNSAQYGGGLFNDEGDVTMYRCTFQNNHASHSGYGSSSSGGGIFNMGGLMAMSGCKVEGNTVNARADGADGVAIVTGGGISNFGTMKIASTDISGNSATAHAASGGASSLGGGIYSGEGRIILRSNVRIFDNSISASSAKDNGIATVRGGGISLEGGDLTFNTGTMITGNTAAASSSAIGGGAVAFGGGIFIGQNAQMTGKSGTISSNSVSAGGQDAFAYGGGMYTRGTATFKYGKVSQNSARLGGGIYKEQGVLNIDPKKVTKNTPDDIYGMA